MKVIALLVAACFTALAWCAYKHPVPDSQEHTVIQRLTAEPDMSPIGGPVTLRQDTGYSRNDVKRLEVLLQRSEHESRKHSAAVVLAEVYGVTRANMNADIFGRSK